MKTYARQIISQLMHAVVLAVLAGAALAHDETTLDKMKAPHGGQLRATGVHHYELVLAPPGQVGTKLPVAVYVTDHAGTEIATQGASGSVTLLSGGQKTVLTLKPQGKNGMQGQGSYSAQAELKAIVLITLAGQEAASAKFTPYAASAPAAAGHVH